MSLEKDLEELELHLGFQPLANVEHPNPKREVEYDVGFVAGVKRFFRNLFGG